MRSSPYGAAAAHAAAAAVRDRLAVDGPAVAIILGSGLGGLAARIEQPRRVPFAGVPGFPPATVVGHSGELIAGRLAGREVLALSGRFHMYEGHAPRLAAFPVRVLHALGARTLFVSNAAGGLRRTFQPGDLMLITDHINLMWRNPLEGPVEQGDERFPDMSAPYDAAFQAQLRAAALDVGVRLVEGVYCGLLGPTYETPAEVRMLDRLGADAVGMSTVPEAIIARAMGMRVAGISCITNMACGITGGALSHAEVIETSARAADSFQAVVSRWVSRL